MLHYINIDNPADMINLTEAQRVTLSMLAKLEKFCSENELSALDIEMLSSVLIRKVQSNKFKVA